MNKKNNNSNNNPMNLVYVNIALLTNELVNKQGFENTDFGEIFDTVADHLYFSSYEVCNNKPDLYFKRNNIENTHAKYYNILLNKIKAELDELLKKNTWLNEYPCQKRIEINRIIEEQKTDYIKNMDLFTKYLTTKSI